MFKKMIATGASTSALALVLLLAPCLGSASAAQAPEPTLTPTGAITPLPLGTPPALPTLPPQSIRPTEPANSPEQTIASLVTIGAIGAPILLGTLLVALAWLWYNRQLARRDISPYLEFEKTGKKFYLTRDAQTLGRASDCQIKIAANLPGADTVSYHHARLLKRDARWVVLDGGNDEMPSLNGVLVNGKRTIENYLNEGDVITFGEIKFRMHIPAPPSTAQTGGTR
jgi:hypothetical protein